MENYAQYSNQVRCPQCGKSMTPGEKFCSVCGTAAPVGNGVTPPAPIWQPGYDANPLPRGESVSKREFRQKYTTENLRKQIRNVSIFGYVLCVVLVVIGWFVSWLSLIDAIVYLGLTLGMHLGKSKGCAIAILVYAILGMVLSLVLSGSVGGWAWIIIGCAALSTFKKMDEQYAQAMAANAGRQYGYQ